MVLSSLSSTFLNLIKMKFIALSRQVGCHDIITPVRYGVHHHHCLTLTTPSYLIETAKVDVCAADLKFKSNFNPYKCHQKYIVSTINVIKAIQTKIVPR